MGNQESQDPDRRVRFADDEYYDDDDDYDRRRKRRGRSPSLDSYDGRRPLANNQPREHTGTSLGQQIRERARQQGPDHGYPTLPSPPRSRRSPPPSPPRFSSPNRTPTPPRRGYRRRTPTPPRGRFRSPSPRGYTTPSPLQRGRYRTPTPPTPPGLRRTPTPPGRRKIRTPPRFQRTPTPPIVQRTLTPPRVQRTPTPPRVQRTPTPPRVRRTPTPPKTSRTPTPPRGPTTSGYRIEAHGPRRVRVQNGAYVPSSLEASRPGVQQETPRYRRKTPPMTPIDESFPKGNLQPGGPRQHPDQNGTDEVRPKREHIGKPSMSSDLWGTLPSVRRQTQEFEDLELYDPWQSQRLHHNARMDYSKQVQQHNLQQIKRRKAKQQARELADYDGQQRRNFQERILGGFHGRTHQADDRFSLRDDDSSVTTDLGSIASEGSPRRRRRAKPRGAVVNAEDGDVNAYQLLSHGFAPTHSYFSENVAVTTIHSPRRQSKGPTSETA